MALKSVNSTELILIFFSMANLNHKILEHTKCDVKNEKVIPYLNFIQRSQF
jgi:hypothetical protein